MIQATLIQTGLRDLLPMVRSGEELSHISAIIRSLCIKLGHFEDDGDAPVPVGRRNLWGLGSAFEEAVAMGLANRWAQDDPDRYMRPGELELAGLIGSPDIADLLEMAIIEIKLTKLSTNNDINGDKFWKYWVQLMAYCRMMEWKRGYLHVCHFMGDYREHRDPVYNIWKVDFSVKQLNDNWSMLKSHSAAMVRERSRRSV